MQNSKIEWTTHTFNPWWGCQRVSPGCEHCYAETMAHRYNFRVWGPAKTTERRMMSENYWRQPIRWQVAAAKTGQRARVFCASMADVFEDHPQIANARMRLFALIDSTPMLDWLLLTKRPENIMPMMEGWLEGTDFPSNIWIGTSCEDQRRADERIPHLLKVPARVRFLSCEPLLGAVNIWRDLLHDGIHWVIVGGESGHGARPMHPDWARSLRDQCRAAGVAFHFKQWGEYRPATEAEQDAWVHQDDWRCKWVDDNGLLYHGVYGGMAAIYKAGKHAAGRLLDGRTWDEVPQ